MWPLSLLLLMLCADVLFADKYVRDGGSSSACTSWSDACDQLTTAEGVVTRGEIIWVADGSYNGGTFDVAASSSTLITIQKATSAAHGTETGWDSGYGDGVATITSEVTFLTDNWVFDGASRSSMTSGHGLKIQYSGGSGNRYLNLGQAFSVAVNNITVRFLEIAGSGSEDDSVVDRGISAHCDSGCVGSSDILLHKVYVHDTGESTLHMFRTQNLTIEYSWIENNGSTPTNHGGGIIVNEGVNNFTFRYSVMTKIEGTAFIETPSGGHPGCAGSNQSNWYIYGNVFHEPQGGSNATGNGVIYVFDHNHTGDFFVYNNTFVNVSNAYVGAEPGSGSAGCIATLTVRNNLFYNISAGGVSAGQTGSLTSSHNAYWDASSIVSGSNSYEDSGAPFVDWTGNDFHLAMASAVEMPAGFTLSSPYAADVDGVTRGADGTFDRGAFEYETGSGVATTARTGGGIRTTGRIQE